MRDAQGSRGLGDGYKGQILKSADRGGGGAAGRGKAKENTKSRARDWLAGKQVEFWPGLVGRKTGNKGEGEKPKKEGGEADQRAREEELSGQGGTCLL